MEMETNKLKRYWNYDKDDTSTWKYIDCKIKFKEGNRFFFRKWILNPNFAYKHLDPYYPTSK